jgi:hemolysin-activating ACP:hemolysin acyltransferase
MPFGPWVDTLKGQILRGHYFFSQIDGRIVGYVGWALTSHQTAREWIENSREIRFDQCLQGPCVLVMAARADGERVNRHQARILRRLLTGEHEVAYWKRTTPRGTRLFTFRPRTAGTREARDAAQQVNIEWVGGQ